MGRSRFREGKMKKIRSAAVAILSLVSGSLLSSSPSAASAFYHNKKLTIVVGLSAGGGFDANARLLARHIGNHIPGHPDVIVQNMPGAGSLTSVRYLNEGAPTDGTVIDLFNFGQIGRSVLEPHQTKVDFRKFNWIGSISTDLSVCYTWHKLGIKTFSQLKKHGLIHMGTTSAGASSDINQRILKYVLGVDLKQIAGYPGSAEVRLAIERGELDGDCGAWSSIPPKWIADKLIDPEIKFSSISEPGIPKGIPFVQTLAPNEHARKIIALLTSATEVGRPFIASSAAPISRIKILRRAFDATMKDPAFLADAKREGLPVYPKNAKQALDVVNSIYAAPPNIVKEARKVATE